MKRVIIVPASDVEHFPGLEILARDASLAALVGNSTATRARDAFDSEQSFLNAVAIGLADRHTFNSLADAAAFAVATLDRMVQAGRKIEAAMQHRSRPQPERQNDGLSESIPWKKNA